MLDVIHNMTKHKALIPLDLPDFYFPVHVYVIGCVMVFSESCAPTNDLCFNASGWAVLYNNIWTVKGHIAVKVSYSCMLFYDHVYTNT